MAASSSESESGISAGPLATSSRRTAETGSGWAHETAQRVPAEDRGYGSCDHDASDRSEQSQARSGGGLSQGACDNVSHGVDKDEVRDRLF